MNFNKMKSGILNLFVAASSVFSAAPHAAAQSAPDAASMAQWVDFAGHSLGPVGRAPVVLVNPTLKKDNSYILVTPTGQTWGNHDASVFVYYTQFENGKTAYVAGFGATDMCRTENGQTGCTPTFANLEPTARMSLRDGPSFSQYSALKGGQPDPTVKVMEARVKSELKDAMINYSRSTPDISDLYVWGRADNNSMIFAPSPRMADLLAYMNDRSPSFGMARYVGVSYPTDFSRLENINDPQVVRVLGEGEYTGRIGSPSSRATPIYYSTRATVTGQYVDFAVSLCVPLPDGSAALFEADIPHLSPGTPRGVVLMQMNNIRRASTIAQRYASGVTPQIQQAIRTAFFAGASELANEQKISISRLSAGIQQSNGQSEQDYNRPMLLETLFKPGAPLSELSVPMPRQNPRPGFHP